MAHLTVEVQIGAALAAWDAAGGRPVMEGIVSVQAMTAEAGEVWLATDALALAPGRRAGPGDVHARAVLPRRVVTVDELLELLLRKLLAAVCISHELVVREIRKLLLRVAIVLADVPLPLAATTGRGERGRGLAAPAAADGAAGLRRWGRSGRIGRAWETRGGGVMAFQGRGAKPRRYGRSPLLHGVPLPRVCAVATCHSREHEVVDLVATQAFRRGLPAQRRQRSVHATPPLQKFGRVFCVKRLQDLCRVHAAPRGLPRPLHVLVSPDCPARSSPKVRATPLMNCCTGRASLPLCGGSNHLLIDRHQGLAKVPQYFCVLY